MFTHTEGRPGQPAWTRTQGVTLEYFIAWNLNMFLFFAWNLNPIIPWEILLWSTFHIHPTRKSMLDNAI